MRLAIIGQQAFGASVLDAFLKRGDEIAGVFCAPEKEGAKPDPLKVAAQERGLRIFQFPSLKSTPARDVLRGLDVDLGVMAYVLQFAPQDFVTIPRFGMIQYHPSLLPNYRGPSSINWPIIKGDTQTGLTIFRPIDGLDEGPVILRKTVAIGPDDTLGSLYFNHLFPLGVEAMLEAADLVVAGRHQEIVQDENQASYEGWCRDKEAQINWHAHIDHTYNLIRGCDPSPGAWTMIGDTRLRIYETRKHPVRRFGDVAGKPGEIAAIGEKGVEIIVQGGKLELLMVRPEGSAKMSAAEFFRSAGITAGSAIADRKTFSEAA